MARNERPIHYAYRYRRTPVCTRATRSRPAPTTRPRPERPASTPTATRVSARPRGKAQGGKTRKQPQLRNPAAHARLTRGTRRAGCRTLGAPGVHSSRLAVWCRICRVRFCSLHKEVLSSEGAALIRHDEFMCVLCWSRRTPPPHHVCVCAIPPVCPTYRLCPNS